MTASERARRCDGGGGHGAGGAGGAAAPANQPFSFLAMDIFRMKGVLAVRRGDDGTSSGAAESSSGGDGGASVEEGAVDVCKHVLQAVHGLFEVSASAECWEQNPACDVDASALQGQGGLCLRAKYSARVVVIGKHLDRRRIERGLRGCLIPIVPTASVH